MPRPLSLHGPIEGDFAPLFCPKVGKLQSRVGNDTFMKLKNLLMPMLLAMIE